MNESIISLLLRLHSQLSGTLDSYSPKTQQNTESESSSTDTLPSENESRIGDGPFFIAKLLDRIANLDPMCREYIIETKNRLWPRMEDCEEEKREREIREKEERRKRAKERQQKLMAEFANKQKEFMQKAMETGKLKK